MPEADEGSFVFGPRDKRGLVAGLRTSQVALLAAGLTTAVVLARAASAPALALALCCPLLALALGWLPVAGRSCDQWLPIVLHYVARSLRRRVGSPVGPSGTVALFESSLGGRPVGVFLDRRQASASAALRLAGAGFDLLDPAEQRERVGAWSALLASLAKERATLRRLQWIERTLPAGRLADEVPEDAGDAGRERALASYRELVRSERAGLTHDLLLVVSVPAPGRALEATRAQLLMAEVGAVIERCAQAGISVLGALGPAELAAAARGVGERFLAPRFGAGPPLPPPRRCRWRAVEAGSLWHATYWIAEWPRHAVGPDFLLPLLLAAEDRRSVSLVMAPVPPTRAVRAAEHARTAKAADAALRARHGFALTARARREEEAVVRREAELAAGHAGYRFSGYVTVHAADEVGLDAAARRAEQAAALCGLSLLRLDGAHDEGLLTALPLGRGLS